MKFLGDLNSLIPRPNPAPIPLPPRAISETIINVNHVRGLIDARIPVQQAVFYNPTPATMLINHTPTIPDLSADYIILPYSMFVLERFTDSQIGVNMSGIIANEDKALVSLMYGYADFIAYVRSITPVQPPLPRPVLAVYIIDANGDFVLSSGGQFVIQP